MLNVMCVKEKGSEMILEIKFKEKNIHEILEMTVEEGLEF